MKSSKRITKTIFCFPRKHTLRIPFASELLRIIKAIWCLLGLIRRKLQTHLEIIERKNKEGMIYLEIMHIIMLAQSYNVNSQQIILRFNH